VNRRFAAVAAVVVVGALLAAGVALAPRLLVAEDGAPERPPNVLVVLWDTVRADRMSLYGHDRPTTPRLEAFARDARVYDLAISPGEWTVPAHGSLFTGLPVSSHGARVGWLWLDRSHLTFAEHFRDHGYATFAWSSNPYLSPETNLLQGFETLHQSWRGDDKGPSAAATRAKLIPDDRSVEISPSWEPEGHGRGWPEHLTAYKDAAPVIAERFLAWVDALREDQPFVAYLNYLEAHHPRVPSMAARRAVSDEETIARALATDASLFRIMAAMEGKEMIAEEERAAMRATYDATLVDLDIATGALLDGLAARGLLDDTIVVLTSDHGENLGERGMWEHRWDLHHTLTHVPLVVRYPAMVAPGRVAAPVSTTHLFGSLLEWTGVPPPEVGYPLPPLGRSPFAVSELVAPTSRIDDVRRAFPDLDRDRWRHRYRAITDGAYALLEEDGARPELTDLRADPGQTRNVAASRLDVVERMRAAVEEWERARPRYDPTKRTHLDRPRSPLKPDPDLSRQLDLLGYAEEEPE
jgi:arylsulfatase A-like enzyme